MDTLEKTNLNRARRSYVPSTAVAKSLSFSDDYMDVTLTDGRILRVPLAWSPALIEASPEERANYELGAGGRGIHWPDLDEDLSIAGLLAGGDVRSS